MVLEAEADYAQIVKTYSLTHLGKSGLPAAVRYSPAEVIKTEKTIVQGLAEREPEFPTSHVEKQNHTFADALPPLDPPGQMAFSKKFEKTQAAVALNFAYYNFIQDAHGALKMTPANGR